MGRLYSVPHSRQLVQWRYWSCSSLGAIYSRPRRPTTKHQETISKGQDKFPRDLGGSIRSLQTWGVPRSLQDTKKYGTGDRCNLPRDLKRHLVKTSGEGNSERDKGIFSGCVPNFLLVHEDNNIYYHITQNFLGLLKTLGICQEFFGFVWKFSLYMKIISFIYQMTPTFLVC